MTTIILYGRPGCHLCDDVHDILVGVQQKYDFELRELNIMEDEALFDKYVVDIPVVTIDGEYFCQYSISANELEAKLDSLKRGQINED
jgi:glutaredoxin